MRRAWRNELLCVAGLGLVLLVAGLWTGHADVLLSAGAIAYLGWHAVHLVLLQRWIGGGRGDRLPVSVGIWESIFDGLQRRRLESRRRRRSLAAAVSELRAAGAGLPDALILVDAGKHVLWFNPAAERLLALRRPRDLGRDVAELVRHPALEDNLASAELAPPVEIASPANGAWILSVQVSAPFGSSRRRLLVARDVTPFHRVEQVRRDFVANVSHELRTPITVFRGYLELLRDAAAGAGWGNAVEAMDEQTTRMQDLVTDLLHLSRLELARRPQSREAVPVPDLLKTIVEEARALSGDKQHRLALTTDAALWLLCDEGELRSAFSNLVFNAVRHTPPGTRIDVSWEGGPDGARLTVRDFGAGIAAHHLPHLTERFYRVDSSRARQSGGTGLGLAIVKHVLERWDGELVIASEPGAGSTFTCRFPGPLVELRPTQQVTSREGPEREGATEFYRTVKVP